MAGACWILILSTITCLLGVFAQENVTLESITIFRTHEWLWKPSLYFQCKNEPRVNLPDVKENDRLYEFAGHESWQPLTALAGVKCKRCGVYEANEVLKDGTFDEWEFCPTAFDKHGRYVHFAEGEFNATFLSSERQTGGSASDSNRKSAVADSGHGNTAVTVVLVLFVFLLVVGVGIVGYMKWQQKKREEQQARFIKLFEEDDDFEKELGF